MRCLLLLALFAAGACAGRSGQPSARSSGDVSTGGGGGEAMSGGDHEPEVVRTGKSFKLSYADARARYGKGARCGGGDAPEEQIGAPDQRNEMQQGKQRLVTYGYRFREGTLLIRCRADQVELQRTLK